MVRMRAWAAIHTWSSLVCTLFLLMLCVTGLPLIFHDEIDAWLDRGEAARQVQAAPRDLAPATMDDLAGLVRQAYPGRAIRFVVWLDEPGQFRFGLGPAPHAAGAKPFALVDGPQRRIVAEAWSEKDWRHGGVMAVLLRLHTDMLAGTPGSLFLGAMGVLFVVALISGVALYAPLMRRFPLGTLRAGRTRRIYCFDLHNLAGMIALAWALLVGLTGIINTLDTVVFSAWQVHAAQHRPKTPPAMGAPVAEPLQHAVDLARRTLPDHEVGFLAMPGSPFSTERDYVVFMRGRGLFSQYLLQPVIVRAQDGALIGAEPPPWYLWLLEGSRPLHFGNFGGLALKLAWAALDVAAIAMLLTGLYLYGGKRLAARRQRQFRAISELGKSD